MARKLIGEILSEKYGVSPSAIEKALHFQKEYGGRLGTILINSGVISEAQLLEALSEQWQMPLFKDFFKKNKDQIDFPQIEPISPSWFLDNQVIPLYQNKNECYLAIVDPTNSFVFDSLENLLDKKKIYYLLCSEGEFRELSSQYKSRLSLEEVSHTYDMDEIEKLKDLASEAPIIKLVNTVISRAIECRASDIHIEALEDSCRIRFRIDGVLNDMDFLPLSLLPPVITRIKIMAGLDIAEKRLPQDGRIDLKVASKDLDIRVATFPTIHGENVVMRLLERKSLELDLEKLGFEEDHLRNFINIINNPFGLVLITGPTGSGKTTTLYSSLIQLNSKEKKIITIEDPVEYQIRGVNQIQVKPSIGLSFASALRSILRQDPDIILVGEIRDRETAEIAIHAALTGHLVLSTLHTNDAPSAISRLLDMGIEDFLINASLIGVLAQRLVRRVCPQCQKEVSVPMEIRQEFRLEELKKKYKVENESLVKGDGCEYCVGTGYRGRIGIFELLIYDDYLKQNVLQYHNYQRLKEAAEAQGMRNLRQDALIKFLKGITTLEEVLRVT